MRIIKPVLCICIVLSFLALAKPVFAAPTVSTQAVSNINVTYATANGSIDDLGGETIVQHGFVWSSTNNNPQLFPSAMPILQYTMNDNAATTIVIDSSGSGNTGTAARNTSLITTTGKINTGFSFNGTSDYVYSTTQYTNPQNFSISVWFKTSSASGKKIVAFENARTGASANYDRQIYVGTDGKVYFGWWTGSAVLIASLNSNYNDNNWHQAIGVYSNGSGTLYVDGQLQGSNTGGTAQNMSGYWRVASASNNTWTAGGNGYFSGQIDDVRVYNVALSPSEAVGLYNLGTEQLSGNSSNNFFQLGSKLGTGSFSAPMDLLSPNTPYYVRSYVVGSVSGIIYGDTQGFTTSSSGYTTWTGTTSSDWNTSGNWSSGVPDSNTEAVINGNGSNAPTIDLSSGSVTIKALSIGTSSTSTLTFSNANTDTKKLVVTADAGIGPNGTITHTANATIQNHVINIDAGNLFFSSGGAINANGKGYQRGAGPGAGSNAHSGAYDAGGAGYGGTGGNGVNNTLESSGGSTYGSINQPIDLGSGGGNGTSTNYGGSGGGLVKLNISGILSLSGSSSISANGSNYAGSNGGGGGSGGSIWITTGTLLGTGAITSNGGNGYDDPNAKTGSGSGGRIALYYTTDFSSATFQAYGGRNASVNYYGLGAAGTLYKKSSSQINGDLIIDNNNQDYADDKYIGKTLLNSNFTFDTITVQNYGYLDIGSAASITYSTLNWSTKGIIADDGGIFDLVSSGESLTIPATARLVGNTPRTFTALTVNGTLTHSSNRTTAQYKLDYAINGDAVVNSGGAINVDVKGFRSDAGPGLGNQSSGTYSGGSSYGGVGGYGVNGTTILAGGTPYGSVSAPTDLGSGGGQNSSGVLAVYNDDKKGGGGAIKLTVSGNLSLSGTQSISANGGDLDSGGSGGSIWITAGTLSGSGTVTANGGAGTGTSYPGGGGGRIAIYYTTDNSSIAYQSSGGGTGTNYFGGAGTIYKKQSSQTYGDVVIDNNNQDSWDDRYIGRTYLNDQPYTFNTLTIQNYGLLDVDSNTNITYSTLNWSTKGIIADNGGTFDLLNNGGSMTIPATARLVGNTSRTFTGLTVNGTLTHSNNTTTAANASVYKLNYTINGDCVVNSGGAINAQYKGYQHGYGPGVGNTSGGGAGSGSGYGGSGSGSTPGLSVNSGGPTYGSIDQPSDLGSGGTDYNSSTIGGAGGGTIKLNISGTLSLAGAIPITTDGANYVGNTAAGGSGGSIWIIAGTLSGSGNITTNGGNGYASAGVIGSGAGGGGRIAIYYTTDNSSINYQAYGGSGILTSGTYYGGAGTIYKKPSGQDYPDLIIDNNNHDNWDNRMMGKTVINDHLILNTLTIQNYGYLSVNSNANISYATLNWSTNGIIEDNGGNLDLWKSDSSSLTIPATARLVANVPRTFKGLIVNGTITHSSNTTNEAYKLNYTVNGDCVINSGGSIDVRYRGYQVTEGSGQGGDNSGGCGGGSYGNVGGRGAAIAAGSLYGSSTQPSNLGSGGGFDNNGLAFFAGSGGGAVKLNISGTFTITGNIISDGQNASTARAGGGSGGSIWITANSITGSSGSISANGGAGAITYGGGGSGGRIAIYPSVSNSYTGSITVNGGNAGYRIGNPGTIVFSREYTSIVDPGSGTGTDYSSLSAWENATATDLTLASTEVFAHGGVTGTIVDGTTVTGATSGKKGELIHATANQALIQNIRTPLAGTVTFTNGSTAVTGSGTSLTTAIAEGEYIWNETDKMWAQVQTITSNTALTLAANYTGAGGSGLTGAVRKGGFQKNEQVRKDASNYITISDNGYQSSAVAKCRATNGTADTTPVVIDGWTTDQNHYIKIYTDPSESYRHKGKWDDSKYHLAISSGTDQQAMDILEDNVRIDGLQISLTGNAGTQNGIRIKGNNDTQLSNNIVKANLTGTALGNGIIGDAASGATAKIWNNLIYDFTNGANVCTGIKPQTSASSYVYNNTLVNDYQGLAIGGGTVVAKNNLVQSSNDGYVGSFASVSDYNLSNVAADAPGSHSKNAATVVFVDATNKDFHLSLDDVTAKNSGANLRQDNYLVLQDDIDGEPRVANWSIGADEFSGSGKSSVASGGTMHINSSQNTQAVNGLVGLWSFNGADLSATTANDRSTTGANCTLHSAVPNTGRLGQGLEFNGTNSYLTCGNVNSSVKTIGFWIKADNVTSKKIMDLNGSAQIELDGAGNITATNFPGNTTIYVDGSTATLIDKSWHFITLTNDSGINVSALELGRVSSSYFDGVLDEVRMYTNQMDAGQVEALSNLGNVKIK